MAKDSFIIYKNFWKPISRLNDDQLGRLFRALCQYQIGEPVEVGEDIAIAYEFFLNQFSVDDKKYEEIVEKRTNASHARSSYQKTSNEVTSYQMESSDVYNDNGKISKENVKKSKCVCGVMDNTNGDTTTPTHRDFLEILFFRNIIAPEKETDKFISYYESTNWTLQGGDVLNGNQRLAKARLWNPSKEGERFPEKFIDAWSKLYKHMPEEIRDFALSDKLKFTIKDGDPVVYCDRRLHDWLFGDGLKRAQEILIVGMMKGQTLNFIKF